MKKALSIIMVMAMVLSMIPVVYAETAEPVVITSGTDVAATVAEPVTYTWTAPANGKLTVTMGAASPGWRYTIYDGEGNTVGLPKTGKTEKSAEFTLTAGTEYQFVATGFNTSTYDECSANITYTLSFAAESAGSGEVVKSEYEVSQTALTLGTNSLTMLDTAITTIFVFEPSETAVYTFTAPEGAILGYWGAGSWFLSDPKSTTNTYEWTCTGVGQSAYIGISGIEGNFALNIEKTGDYTVVEIPIVKYENKATLESFTLPEGAQLHGYIDVTAETNYTAVLGTDGYYHLNSADGDVILVDMDYQDIILSAALKSDRPVMYVHDTDENGNKVKYDIGDAVLAYEAVMDANGYYPLTEDLIYFYDNYANGAAIYTFHVSGSYNEDNIWMYCMRTVTLPEVAEPDPTEPSEPEVTEPEVTEPEATEPEVTEPEVTEPEVTEPEVTEPEITEPIVTEPSVATPDGYEMITSGTGVIVEANDNITYSWTAPDNGILKVTVRAGTPGWRYEITNGAGDTIGRPQTGKVEKSAEFEVTAGTVYQISMTGWDSENQEVVANNISYNLSFLAKEEEIEKVEKEYSGIILDAGTHTLELSDTAIYTLYRLRPSAAGTYIITVPEGATIGYWGATTNYLVNPNSTSNTCEWTCSSVGQSAYLGVTGVTGSFTLTVTLKEVDEPEVTEPTEPEVTEPEVTEPSVPETSEPEVSEPTATKPADAIYVSDSTTLTNLMSTTKSGTIVLSNDISLGSSVLTIPAGSNIVLDLNGYTLSGSKSSGGIVDVQGNLTVQDSSAEGDGLIQNNATSSSYGILVSKATGALTFHSGSVSAATQAIRVAAGSLLMQGGTLTATNYGIYVASGATADISGGYVNSGFNTFNNVVYSGSTATVSISGGWFNGGAPSGNGLVGGISGGCFARKPSGANATNYLATDCYWEDRLDTVYLFEVINPNAVPEEPEPSEPEDTEPEATEIVDRWNLVLDDDLKVNFYMNIADAATAQVEVTVGTDIFLFEASTLQVSEDGKYIVSVNAAAAQMMDAITVKIVGDPDNAKTYTIRQYADVVLADSNLSQYHALIKEMLNYGAAAQVYFEYNDTILANANITGTNASDIPAAADAEHKVNTDIEGIVYYGSSLVFKDKIAVRFYFDAEAAISGYTFTVNGKTYTPVANGDLYFIEIADICPQDLDKQITITVSDGADGSLTVSYGPMNYIVRMNNNTDIAELKDLLKALYNYHLAAKALRAN